LLRYKDLRIGYTYSTVHSTPKKLPLGELNSYIRKQVTVGPERRHGLDRTPARLNIYDLNVYISTADC
jgi:hypothetical protein